MKDNADKQKNRKKLQQLNLPKNISNGLSELQRNLIPDITLHNFLIIPESKIKEMFFSARDPESIGSRIVDGLIRAGERMQPFYTTCMTRNLCVDDLIECGLCEYEVVGGKPYFCFTWPEDDSMMRGKGWVIEHRVGIHSMCCFSFFFWNLSFWNLKCLFLISVFVFFLNFIVSCFLFSNYDADFFLRHFILICLTALDTKNTKKKKQDNKILGFSSNEKARTTKSQCLSSREHQFLLQHKKILYQVVTVY